MKYRPLALLPAALLTGLACLGLVKAADRGEAAAPSLDEARLQAEVLHDAMHATLQTVHDRYYREDEGLPIPAATMNEVFAELARQRNITLRWLAVEGQAMNSDHKPQTDFEHQAVEALKRGKPHLERIADGVYHRAGPITLSNHCLKCHVPNRKSTDDRNAGLIISIPLGPR